MEAEKAETTGAAMGPWMATALVMGVMIGSGIFLLPAQLAPYGWNSVAAWVLSIGGSLCLAWVIARLTVSLPDRVGPTGFVNAAFGPIPSFMIGWSYWIANAVALVTVAVAAVSYLSIFAPGIGSIAYLPALLAVAILWAVTLINLRGARASGAFQIATMTIKLLPMLAVIVISCLMIGGKGPTVIAPLPASGLDFGAISSAAILTLWALTGFETASIAAAAVARPHINIPRATMIGTALTGIIYLVVCSSIILLLPPTLIGASNAPFATFVETFWGRSSGLFIAACAAVAAIGAMNGLALMQGELQLSMARQKTLPSWLGVTNARGMPVRALLLSSTVATLFVLANSSRTMSDLFGFLAKLSTSATLWLYLGCALAAIRLRIAVIVAIVGAIYSSWALWGAGIEVSGLSFVLMAGGLPLYWWARRGDAGGSKTSA
jgi:APA family basic amino acid/polyamine antiporter